MTTYNQHPDTHELMERSFYRSPETLSRTTAVWKYLFVRQTCFMLTFGVAWLMNRGPGNARSQTHIFSENCQRLVYIWMYSLAGNLLPPEPGVWERRVDQAT